MGQPKFTVGLGQHFQERGFAAAVPADNGYAIAVADPGRKFFKTDFMGERQAVIIHRNRPRHEKPLAGVE